MSETHIPLSDEGLPPLPKEIESNSIEQQASFYKKKLFKQKNCIFSNTNDSRYIN
jgi:hypothetical protein